MLAGGEAVVTVGLLPQALRAKAPAASATIRTLAGLTSLGILSSIGRAPWGD
jgi:hypothetical protein